MTSRLRVVMMLDQDRYTPTLAVSDPQGRTVRSVAYCSAASSTVAEARVSRIKFDAVGRAAAQWDPRLWALRAEDPSTPSNLENMYSLSGVLLTSRSVDAGVRVNLTGELGQVLHSWDGRWSQQKVEYDELLRPTAVFEQALNSSESCIARYVYGAADGAFAGRNQYGQVIRLDSSAGTCHFSHFSIKGALLAQQQYFLRALEPPHWPEPLSDRDELLESGEGATTRMVFNALGELVMQTDAQGNQQQFDHNVDGQLRQTRLRLKEAEPKVLVRDIHYNAQGEVTGQTAGNGVVSLLDYAPQTGRLLRLYASLPQQQPLQDLNYVHDPVGNILSIEDKALAVRHFANQRIEPINHYTYDSLYQLVEATGWEAGSDNRGPDQIADPQAVASYHQAYRYDGGGNLLELVHKGPQRHGRVLTAGKYSNRCLAEHNGQAPTQDEIEAGFDPCGNLRSLDNARALGWNLRNQLSEVRPVERESGLDDREHYIYDVDGLRQRKIRSVQTNVRTVISETRYLPGLEVRTNNATGETLYVISAQAGRNSVQVLHWKDSPPKGLANRQYRYSLGDLLGSCTLELDSQAKVVSRETYHPFGTTAFSERGVSSESSYRTMCYSGKERDATGLYYYGLRYYMPWLQRWVNPDPKGYLDGPNVYAFVGGNPITFMDGDGAVRIDVSNLTKEQKKAIDLEGPQVKPAWKVHDAGRGEVKPSSKTRELSSEMYNSFKQGHATNLITKTLLIEGSPNQFVDLWRSRRDPADFLQQRQFKQGTSAYIQCRTGNCGEHSEIAFSLLASTKTEQPVFRVNAQGVDHAFVVIGDRRQMSDEKLVIVDPWPNFPMVHTADVGEFRIGNTAETAGRDADPAFRLDDATLKGNSEMSFPVLAITGGVSDKRRKLIKEYDDNAKARSRTGKSPLFEQLFSIEDKYRGMLYMKSGKEKVFNNLPASYVNDRMKHYSSYMNVHYGLQ